MGVPAPLQHIDQYGEANLDAQTLRILRKHAIDANAEDEAMRDLIVTKNGEDTAKTEWDPLFEKDTVDRKAAIDRIEAELTKRGLSFR